MALSVAAAVFMLVIKIAGWLLTGSTAILSDAAESVLHLATVGFAAFSYALSRRPASRHAPYGYERIAFFSAGFEGAAIIMAGLAVIALVVEKWRRGFQLEKLGFGTLLIAASALINAALGLYLLRTGRRTHSRILEANGKHVLADSWTSGGVILGLLLVMATGQTLFDPLFALLVAANILFTGASLVRNAIRGLLDLPDPKVAAEIEQAVSQLCREKAVAFHDLRYRDSGTRLLVSLHLLFPYATPLGRAHQIATEIEDELPRRLARTTDVITHLESLEDHAQVHPAEDRAGAETGSAKLNY